MDHDSYYFQSQYGGDSFEIMEKENYSNYEDFFSENPNEVEGEALLISLVRDYPYLYNKELSDFKDIIKKQNAWAEIGIALKMTVEECQTRWTRLRERYTREKKQREQETTTGSGACKRKSFEFFENMQFLERFVKRRRTTTNIKSAPSVRKYSSLQKNFDPSGERRINTDNVDNMNTSGVARNPRNFDPSGERRINTDNVDNMNTSSVARNPRNFDPSGEKRINIDNVDNDINIDLSNTAQCSKNSNVASDISQISSISGSSTNDYTRNKGLTRSKPKGKNTDILQSTLCKVSSLLEDRFPASSSTSSSSPKPEINEGEALCQLIFTSLKNMPLHKKTDKKKELLRIMFDI